LRTKSLPTGTQILKVILTVQKFAFSMP
jgi:hypothetical protein